MIAVTITAMVPSMDRPTVMRLAIGFLIYLITVVILPERVFNEIDIEQAAQDTYGIAGSDIDDQWHTNGKDSVNAYKDSGDGGSNGERLQMINH
jgi:hypothetical protein